jgi:hypothetical protein
MTCLATCAAAERVWSHRHKPLGPGRPDEVEVDGTWDFKWRRGSVIRLAFQTPPDADPVSKHCREVMREIAELARTWKTAVTSDGLGPAQDADGVPLTLHFLDGKLLPAPPPGMATQPQPELGFDEAVHYDVLISLATLPVEIPAAPRREKQTVVLPRAELGRFASRIEYGSPTAFLGPLSAQEGSGRFWISPKWRHIVVHELGHILGLAHPYQQHDAVLEWKSDEELKRLLPGQLGVPMSDDVLQDYIDRQLKARLPRPAGKSFSDLWKKPVETESVMNPAFLPDLIEPRGNGGPPPAPRKTDSAGPWITQPTKHDLRHLRSMYTRKSN